MQLQGLISSTKDKPQNISIERDGYDHDIVLTCRLQIPATTGLNGGDDDSCSAMHHENRCKA